MTNIYYAVAHRSLAEIDSFKTRYDDFDQSLIPDIFSSSLNLTATKWTPSTSWGSSHVIFFVDTKEQGEFVLRANTGFNSIPEYVMETEKLITDQILKLGIPTNRILHVDISRKNFPFDFQIQEVLLGKDPEIHFHGTQTDYDHISYDLGAKVAMYHQLMFDGFGRFDEAATKQGILKGEKTTNYNYVFTCLESDLKYLVEAKVISSTKAKTIVKIFTDHQTLINLDRGVLVHHDLADHNLTFENDKVVGIFDWEAAVISDPVLDLASCPTWRTIFPREEKLLEGYQSVVKLPENFTAKRNIYVLRTMLWKMVYAIRMNIVTDDRKAKFYSALKPFHLN